MDNEMKYQHGFNHADDEECTCFDVIKTYEAAKIIIDDSKVKNKRIYNAQNMQYYPFSMCIMNERRFIPMGDAPVITIVDKRGIFKVVSSRTYARDSIIYFDKDLRPLLHYYFHKYVPQPEILTRIDNRVIRAYPHRPTNHFRDPEYMNWKF